VVTHQSRLSYLGQRFKAKNGVPVTYVSKTGEIEIPISIPLACPVLYEATEESPELAIVRYERQDWFIDVADIGLLFPPDVNHVIRTADGAEFQVLPIERSSPPYRYTTSIRDRVCIHTVLTKLASDAPGDHVQLTADELFVVVSQQYLPGATSDASVVVD